MKIFLVLAVTLLVSLLSLVRGDDCSYDEVKKCYNLEYLFADGAFQWPTDDDSVQKLCGKLLEGGTCFKGFVDRCSKLPAAKAEFDKKIAALRMYHESVCGSTDGRAMFLDRIGCYSQPAVVAPMKAAHKKFVAMVEKLPAIEKTARKQAFCCSILYLKDSAKGPVTANCKAHVVEYLKGLMQMVAGAFRDKCGSVTDFAGCTAALPGSLGADLTGIANGGEPTTVNKIAFPTLFQMWQDM